MSGLRRCQAIMLMGAVLFGAAAQQGGQTGQGGMGAQRGMGPGAMGQHMGRMMDSSGMMDSCAMWGMGMMHMMKPQFVLATPDGGFVVFMGNKIMKYDKNLDLKKEVEMKLDTMAMERWKQHMQNCPMMKHGPGAKGSDTTGAQRK
jgi:hypothetical protein